MVQDLGTYKVTRLGSSGPWNLQGDSSWWFRTLEHTSLLILAIQNLNWNVQGDSSWWFGILEYTIKVTRHDDLEPWNIQGDSSWLFRTLEHIQGDSSVWFRTSKRTRLLISVIQNLGTNTVPGGVPEVKFYMNLDTAIILNS